jgi:hypothetical protein
MDDFKKLQVWTRAHEVTLEAYRVMRTFPREELYGLTAQVRRAAASIRANIVRKGVAGGAMVTCAGSCASRVDQRQSRSTTFF